jgi:hypothetical protein
VKKGAGDVAAGRITQCQILKGRDIGVKADPFMVFDELTDFRVNDSWRVLWNEC